MEQLAPSPEISDKIKLAVRIKVEGATWDEVANKLGYENGDSARQSLKGPHREEWRKQYEEAYLDWMPDVEAEAISTQRKHMKSAKDDISQRAAHSLMAHCAKLRAQKIDMAVDTAAGYRRVVEEAERIRHELVLKEQGDLPAKE